MLGKIEEGFPRIAGRRATLSCLPGKVLRFEGIREQLRRLQGRSDLHPKVPAYAGGKFPTTTYLVGAGAQDAGRSRVSGHRLPEQVSEWLAIQKERSVIPGPDDLLVETFPRGGRYLHGRLSVRGPARPPDAGHAADRRLDRAKARPLGFVATDYCALPSGACATWAPWLRRGRRLTLAGLFDEDMLGDDLESVDGRQSFMLKRTFRLLCH